MTAELLADLIIGYRYVIGNESSFQDGLSWILEMNRIVYVREHNLGRAFGRIDFYLPDEGIGIELKVKGSPTEVIRQLHRYAQSPEIHALILVTGRSRLSPNTDELNGKPLITASVWQGQL
jgi:hypothetical protein